MTIIQSLVVAFSAVTLLLITSCAQSDPTEPTPSAALPAEGKESTNGHTNRDSEAALTPPISIVNASEYADGGTTFVHLKDSDQRELLICVSVPGAGEVIPADTLFLDAPHPQFPDARLPASEQEAAAALRALETAIYLVVPESERQELQKLGDPLEHLWGERLSRPAASQRSADEWKRIFAFDALRRLSAKSDFAILDASGTAEPDWYKTFDAQRRERIAEQQKRLAEDARFMSFYPEDARELFVLSGRTDEVQVQPAGVDPSLHDESIREQGERLANAVGNPQRLSEISCRALGTLDESWNVMTTRDQIAIQALLTVTADDLLAALPKLTDDEQAMLGAARVFFYFRYGEKLPEPAWEQWAPTITKVALESGPDANKATIVQILAVTQHPQVLPLLRSIARGEIGAEPDLSEQWDEEPGLKESAYLALALRNDETVREEIKQLASESMIAQNRAALEVSLALLGDPTYLTRENLELDSHSIGFAALRAIERFEGKHGMDLLMTSGLDHPYAAVANEALLTAQRITGQQWVPKESQFQPSKYADEAQAWWEENRGSF